GWPGFGREPADEQGGCNVEGQVGHDPRRRAPEMRARVERDRIACLDVELTRITRRELTERRERALVALDRDDMRLLLKKRAGEPAGAGADLDHGHAGERTRGARDAAGEVEIEQKILAERFLGGKAVPSDHLAQRRQIIGRAHAGSAKVCVSARSASLAASFSAAIRLVGSARPLPAMSKAVP